MTAPISNDKSQRTATRLPGRRKARTGLALLVTLVAVAGLWGTFASVQGVRTSMHAGAATWPAGLVQKLELAAGGLLVLAGLAACVLVLLRLTGDRRRLEQVRDLELERLSRFALSDSLTGLGNHRGFHEHLGRELARRARTGSCFSVVMLDLDGLKNVNDTLGHQAGDEKLQTIAACLRATAREGDGTYRTGGDEFMALLPGERAWGGLEFARRLQAEVARRGKTLEVSCGIAEPEELESAHSLVRRADIALYEAKRSGRRIVGYSDGIAPKPAGLPNDVAILRHQRLLATTLVHAVDAKDAGTRNHCETVSSLCVLIGQALDLGDERLEQLRLAGLLHDVGKIGVPDALLHKPSVLDLDEKRELSAHVELGHSIMATAGFGQEAEWILHHHERFDGSGYPEGLRASEIPLESRIICVADAFETITADRPYGSTHQPGEALAELERRASSQFDPECVEALRSALDSEASTVVEAAPPYTNPKVVSV